ncbi:hypothetical protein AAG906_026838 [Vitis piasezkii]
MINAPNEICFNSSPSKVVLVRSNTTFNDLVACLSQALCKGSSQVKLKLVYHYAINLGDGNFNFATLLINDDDDVSLMFNVATKFTPPHIIENVDCTIELSIDVLLIPSKKMVDLDDTLEISEDYDKPIMNIDSNAVHDMVMSEGYVYEAPENHDLKIMMLID